MRYTALYCTRSHTLFQINKHKHKHKQQQQQQHQQQQQAKVARRQERRQWGRRWLRLQV
jgi:hypothetical protein